MEREGVLTADPADDRIRYTDGGGRVYRFERSGEIATITNPISLTDPAAATYAYDGSGRLLTVTDPVAGRSMNLVYAGVPGSGSCPSSPGGFDSPAATGLLCAANYWDGSPVQLFYVGGQLARFVGPGDGTVGRDTWDFSYTAGKLAKVRDPFTSDVVAAGLRADGDTTRWLYTYDGNGRVSSITAPEPLAGAARPGETYTYGTGSATVDRIGTTANPDRSITFDAKARIVAETDAAGLTSTTTFDAQDRPVGTTDGAGRRTTSIFDQHDNLVEQWGPAPAASFNTAGVPAGHEAQTPHHWTGYDDGLVGLAVTWWNNPSQTGTPSGHTTGLTEVPSGAVNYNWGSGVPAGSGVTNPNGFSGRLTGRITFPNAGTYYLGVGRNGAVKVLIDDVEVLSGWAEADTDIASVAITTSAGQAKDISIEVADTGTVSPADQFRLLLTWYHASTGWQTVPGTQLRPDYGLPTRHVDPDGRRVDRVYASPADRLATQVVADPGGLALTSAVSYESGELRRPLTRTLPAGAATTTTTSYYDNTETADNPCTGTVEAVNQGGMPKLTTAADPDGAGPAVPIVREVRYNSAGQPVATRVGSESWTCTTYDGRGRLASKAYPGFGILGPRTVTYGYALGGNPLISFAADPIGSVTTTTDLLGREVSTTDVFSKTKSTTYDQAGRVTQETGPMGTLGYTYDSASRLASESLDGATVAVLSYNANGELSSVSYPTPGANGTSLAAIGRDTTGSTTSLQWNLNGSVVSDAVTRSLGGNVLNQVIDGVDPNPGSNNFSYDPAGRLTSASVPGNTYTYSYAPTGGCGTLTTAGRNTNRTSVVRNGVTATYCYDNADRLTSTTQSGYSGAIQYDSHGNTTTLAGETRYYDAADRHWATSKASLTVQLWHDPLDRLVARSDGTTTTYYSYGATLDSSLAVIERTLTLPGGVLLTKRSSGDIWSYPNIHGDVMATANSTGVKQGATLHWSPFGEALTAIPDNSTSNMDYGWLGQHKRPVEHTAGLVPTIEMGMRQYDPALGRFLEVDPVVAGSCNDYEYGCGDAVNNFDLNGTDVCTGKRNSYVVGTFKTRYGSTVRMKCGFQDPDDPHRGYGWRHIEATHFELNGFWTGQKNYDTIKTVLRTGKRTREKRLDANGKLVYSNVYKLTIRCHCGSSHTWYVVVSDGGDIITAYYEPTSHA